MKRFGDGHIDLFDRRLKKRIKFCVVIKTKMIRELMIKNAIEK